MTYNILVVEDEPEILEAYQSAFPIYGLNVLDVARSGSEAVEKYKALKDSVDLVVMDHRMPDKSGFEASQEIFACDPEALIIFCSADSHVQEQALALGASAFLNKPFDVAVLVEKIRFLLGR